LLTERDVKSYKWAGIEKTTYDHFWGNDALKHHYFLRDPIPQP